MFLKNLAYKKCSLQTEATKMQLHMYTIYIDMSSLNYASLGKILPSYIKAGGGMSLFCPNYKSKIKFLLV